MLIPILLIGFALVISALGGRYADAEQLYYDMDFQELYDASDDTGRALQGGESYDGQEESPPQKSSRMAKAAAKSPEAMAREIYDSVDV